MTEQHWIVAAVKPRTEQVAGHKLRRLGYGAYVPMVVTADETLAAPMFPGYVFIDIAPQGMQWIRLLSENPITRILRTGDCPCRMPDRHIQRLRDREEGNVIRLKRIAAALSFEPGQAVRVHEGNFTGFEGVFERVSGAERVMILLNLFGREVSVEIDAADVA